MNHPLHYRYIESISGEAPYVMAEKQTAVATNANIIGGISTLSRFLPSSELQNNLVHFLPNNFGFL